MSILTMIGKAIWDLIRAVVGSIGALFNGLFGGVFKPGWESLRRVFKFDTEEVKRPLLVLISILVISISLVSIYLTLRTPTAQINLKPFEGLGEAAAQETAKLLGGQGEVVVLALSSENLVPALETPIASFRKAIKASSRIRIRETETIKVELEGMFNPISPFGSELFFQLLNKHIHADAIVSFVEIPAFQDADWEKFPKRRPKIILVSSFSPHLKQLIEQDIVQLAITTRYQQSPETKEPQTNQEWFDRHYMVVTKENISALPEYGIPAPAGR